MSHVDMDGLLAALQATSDSFAEKQERIALLEASVSQAEADNIKLRSDLAALVANVESAETAAKTATQQADQAEAQVQVYRQHAEDLQSKLIVTIDDLSDIGSAVGALLTRL